jgi:2'-5' RNA ligase
MSERLFFALWPDEPIRAAIAHGLPEWTAGLDGGLLRPDQWHVTLEFIGAVDAGRRPALQAAADTVPMPSFELQFDRCEHWREPQVTCLVAAVTPVPLASFVAQLRAAVAAAGFAPDHRPYRPHVTLARKVRTAVDSPVAPPLCWAATGFALVRSTSDPAGSRYEPVHWWNAGTRSG